MAPTAVLTSPCCGKAAQTDYVSFCRHVLYVLPDRYSS